MPETHKWKSCARGVRYYEHPTRKHGARKDRYFAIAYSIDGKRTEQGMGWASDGWTVERAIAMRSELRWNARTGQGPRTVKEMHSINRAAVVEAEAVQAEARRRAVSFDDFVQDVYLPHVKANKPATAYPREERLYRLHIKRVLRGVRLAQVSEVHLHSLVRSMRAKELSNQTIVHALAVVRQVINHAMPEYFTGKNPVNLKQLRVKLENKRLRWLTPEEAAELLDAIRKRSEQTYEMALFSLHTGARFGEIAALRWSNVHLDQGAVTLLDTKSRDRVVFLTPELLDILRNKASRAASSLVFPARGGNTMTQVSNAFERAIIDVRLNEDVTDNRMRVTFHTLRHTHASWLAQRGVELSVIQKQLGHGSFALVQRYAHLAPDNLRVATAVISQMAATSQPPAGKVVHMVR